MIKRDLYYERISTKSLRDDVRYLGNILGKVIKDQEGENFFKLVEKINLGFLKNLNVILKYFHLMYHLQEIELHTTI